MAHASRTFGSQLEERRLLLLRDAPRGGDVGERGRFVGHC
jgi:hypothetical protein